VPVADTSIEIHRNLKESGEISERQLQALRGLWHWERHYGRDGVTSSELMRFLRVTDPNRVRPRLNELKEMGLIEIACKRAYRVSGHKQEAVRRVLEPPCVTHGSVCPPGPLRPGTLAVDPHPRRGLCEQPPLPGMP